MSEERLAISPRKFMEMIERSQSRYDFDLLIAELKSVIAGLEAARDAKFPPSDRA